MYRSSDPRPLAWLMFLLSALTAIGFFFIPAFIIRPFRHQTSSALHLAMALRQQAPWVTLVAALVCLIFAIMLSQSGRLTRRIVLPCTMVLVVFSAVMVRMNYFEWMFHPVEDPRFEVEAASKLDKDEMVLAIGLHGEQRAYPISEMAYHHIVNDTVGGVPVVATY